MAKKINNKRRRRFLLIFFIMALGIAGVFGVVEDRAKAGNISDKLAKIGNRISHEAENLLAKPADSEKWSYLPRWLSSQDKNENGRSDTLDLIEGARAEAARKPVYKNAYYSGGYPPDNEGVCTDVIWRALKEAGHDLKTLIDDDIKADAKAYPRTGGKPDPNIDFRRVPNQRVFFTRHGQSLDTELKPGDSMNLAIWQPGDIVTFVNPDHIAILSDKRNADGVPYLLHNDGPWASEGDDFMFWYKKGITGHYRYPDY